MILFKIFDEKLWVVSEYIEKSMLEGHARSAILVNKFDQTPFTKNFRLTTFENWRAPKKELTKKGLPLVMKGLEAIQNLLKDEKYH